MQFYVGFRGTPKPIARYEYDVFGNCTVYDSSNNKINTDPDFIGNINPFRWKGFYYDTESGLYYANGSYYDPQTGLYVDASPISTVIENAFTTHALDRNAPLCNNILELACMPYTIDVDTELHPDPTYQLQQDWLSKVIFKFSSMLNKLDTGERLLIASLLFVAALFIGYKLGGASLVCELISDVIISTGVGIISYGAFSYLYYGRVTETGLADAAVNSFLVASFFAFVYSSVNAVKYLCRSRIVSTAELAREVSPDLGNKLDYAFGKATGSKHNIDRSAGMLRELERIGIKDNEIGRNILKENLVQSFYTPNNILGPGSVSGSIIKDSLLAGPYGFLRVNSYWIENKLITIIFMRH